MTLKLLHTHLILLSSLRIFSFHTYIVHGLYLLARLICNAHGLDVLQLYMNPLKFGLLLFMWIFSPSCARDAHLFFLCMFRHLLFYHQSRPKCTFQIGDDKRWWKHFFFMKIPINFTPFQFQWCWHCALRLHLILETLQGFYFNVKWTNSKAYHRFASTQQNKVAATNASNSNNDSSLKSA